MIAIAPTIFKNGTKPVKNAKGGRLFRAKPAKIQAKNKNAECFINDLPLRIRHAYS